MPLKRNNANAWNEKGKAFCEQKKYEEAIGWFTKSLMENPNNAQVLYNKGLAFFHLSKYDDAVKFYDAAIIIDPNYTDAWNEKCKAFCEQKKYEEAIAWLLQLDPNHVNGQYQLLDIKEKTRQPEQKVEHKYDTDIPERLQKTNWYKQQLKELVESPSEQNHSGTGKRVKQMQFREKRKIAHTLTMIFHIPMEHSVFIY